MSADVVNLRQARKQKARIAKSDKAVANIVKHGRSKAEKQRAAADADLATRRLDQLKLDDQGHDDRDDR